MSRAGPRPGPKPALWTWDRAAAADMAEGVWHTSPRHVPGDEDARGRTSAHGEARARTGTHEHARGRAGTHGDARGRTSTHGDARGRARTSRRSVTPPKPSLLHFA